jgi:membrane-bound ClpP family serine protease
VRKAVVGVIVAIALAVSLSGASIAGIAAWKIVLAAAGAVIFVATGKGSVRTDQ